MTSIGHSSYQYDSTGLNNNLLASTQISLPGTNALSGTNPFSLLTGAAAVAPDNFTSLFSSNLFSNNALQAQGQPQSATSQMLQQGYSLISYIALMVLGALSNNSQGAQAVQAPLEAGAGTGTDSSTLTAEQQQRSQDWTTNGYENQIKTGTALDFNKYVGDQLSKDYLAQHAEPKAPTKPTAPNRPNGSAPTAPTAPTKPIAPRKNNYDFTEYNLLKEDYLKANKQYETDLATYTTNMNQYKTDKANYDKKMNPYYAAKKKYDAAIKTYNTDKAKFDKDHKTWADDRTAYTSSDDNKQTKITDILNQAKEVYINTGSLPEDLKAVQLQNA